MKAESRVNFLIYYRRSLTQSASWLMQRGSVVRFVIWAWNICNLWLSHCKKRGLGTGGAFGLPVVTTDICHWWRGVAIRTIFRTLSVNDGFLLYMSMIIISPPTSSSQGFFLCQCQKRKVTSAFDNSVQVLEQGTGDHNKQGMDCWHLAMKSLSKKNINVHHQGCHIVASKYGNLGWLLVP